MRPEPILRPPHHDWIRFAIGAFDTPTSTKLALHIFVDESDCCDIKDALPQNRQ